MQDEKMVAEYLVQSLNDNLDDLEDRFTQLNKEYKRNYRECDLLQRNHERIKKEYQFLQQSVKSKCELIEKNGLTITNLDPFKLNNESNELQHHQLYIKENSFVNQNNQIPNPIYHTDTINSNTISDNVNSKKLNNKSDEIKQNGYCEHDLISNPNNSLNSSPHNKIHNKCNGQIDSSNTNGHWNNSNSNLDLTNGYINKPLISNGIHNSLNNSSIHNSNYQPNHSSLNKRYTDLSSCSSLSSTNDKTSSSASLIFSEELYHHLVYIEGKTLNEKINFLLHDKINKLQKIKSLRSGLDDEKIKSIKLESLSLINGKQLNGDLSRRFNKSEDCNKTIDNCKKELELLSKQMEQLSEAKSQIDKDILQLKSRLQTMEDAENELKTEKRKLHREFRESQTKIEELNTENYHLKKRIEKLSKNTKIPSNIHNNFN